MGYKGSSRIYGEVTWSVLKRPARDPKGRANQELAASKQRPLSNGNNASLGVVGAGQGQRQGTWVEMGRPVGGGTISKPGLPRWEDTLLGVLVMLSF